MQTRIQLPTEQELRAKAKACAKYLEKELRAEKNVEGGLKAEAVDKDVFLMGPRTRCTITVDRYPFTDDKMNFSIAGTVRNEGDHIELTTARELPSSSDDKNVEFHDLDDFESVKRLALKFFIARS
jgi:hypothetical protein